MEEIRGSKIIPSSKISGFYAAIIYQNLSAFLINLRKWINSPKNFQDFFLSLIYSQNIEKNGLILSEMDRTNSEALDQCLLNINEQLAACSYEAMENSDLFKKPGKNDCGVDN